MTACLWGGRVTFPDRSLFDLRYFYVDAEGIGRFTCGIAFETMTSILRTYDDCIGTGKGEPAYYKLHGSENIFKQ